MDDELDFLEFLGLFNLLELEEKLSDFTLYNPNSDEEFEFVLIEGRDVTYRKENSSNTYRQVNDLKEWIVICPKQSKILSSRFNFENYKGFKFSVSHSGKLAALKCYNVNYDKFFVAEVDLDLLQSYEKLKVMIDNFILSDHKITLSFSNQKEDYLGFEIFQFDHSKGSRLFAISKDSYPETIITDDVLGSNKTRLYSKVDEEVLSDINHFKFAADKIEDFLNCQTLHVKTIERHNFKTFLQFRLIHQSSGEGKFEKLKSLHLKQVEEYCRDRALKDDDFFELVAQEKSYGGVLTAQFVNFRNKHLIKIFLNKLEILSEIDDGPAESKLRAYVDQVKVKYFSKIREILEENHRKFKERAIGPHAPISISYDEKRYIRLTHCWNCKNDIDSLNFYTCNECTGIICFCGACFCSHTGY
jgi:hypothetical protein